MCVCVCECAFTQEEEAEEDEEEEGERVGGRAGGRAGGRSGMQSKDGVFACVYILHIYALYVDGDMESSDTSMLRKCRNIDWNKRLTNKNLCRQTDK